jgi:hypothetical protein
MTNVFRLTRERATQLHTAFRGAQHPNRVAVHFAYTRAVGERPATTIEYVDLFELSVDLFELSADGQRFIAQRIIYDTGRVRADFESPR